MPTTIRDIAAAADVSPSTVSLVLSGRGRVGADTRSRVQAVARNLSYTPRPVGRPSRGDSVEALSVGVLYPPRVINNGHIYPVAHRWITSIRETLQQEGHNLSLFAGADQVSSDHAFRDAVLAGFVQGIVLVGATPEDGYLQWLLEQRVPVVVMNRRPEREEFSYVTIDNRGGGRLVATRFAELGHRDVAVICLPGNLELTRAHMAGFREAAGERGLEVQLAAVADEPMDTDVRAVCEEVANRKITAVFCEGDSIALACANRLSQIGLRLPDDVSVIGFNNLGLTTSWGARVASVSYDADRMGAEAARMTIKLLKQRDFRAQMSLVVTTQLVEGQTLGTANVAG